MIDPLTAYNLERPLLILLSTLYGLALVFYCPPRVKGADKIKTAGWFIHLAALLAHAFLLYARISSTGHAPLASLYETLLVLSFATSLAFLILSFKKQTFGYGRGAALVSWMIILSLLLLHIFKVKTVVPRYLKPVLYSPFFAAHAASGFLAYGCFVLAFFAAVTSLWVQGEKVQERRRVAEFYLWPGIILFTLSLGLGGAASFLTWGSWWVWGVKSVFSLVTWGFMFLAIASRADKKWGRSAFSFLVIAGFLVMVFTYFFANQGFHDFI